MGVRVRVGLTYGARRGCGVAGARPKGGRWRRSAAGGEKVRVWRVRVRVHLVMRRIDLGHLEERDAEGPDVGGRAVGPRLDELGRHPQRRADDRRTFRVRRDRGRHPEVAELDAPAIGGGEQDVARLDVTVQELPRLVQVVQARHRRRGDHRDLVLEHRGTGRTQDVRDGTAAAVLHTDPQHAPLGQAAKVAHDPLRVTLLEHLDFRLQLALERVALRRVLRWHRLHSHTPVAIHRSEDRAV